MVHGQIVRIVNGCKGTWMLSRLSTGPAGQQRTLWCLRFVLIRRAPPLGGARAFTLDDAVIDWSDIPSSGKVWDPGR